MYFINLSETNYYLKVLKLILLFKLKYKTTKVKTSELNRNET